MKRETGILYLLLSGSKVGGAEVQYLYLIDGLRGKGYNPIVLCPDRGNLYEDLISWGVPVHIMRLPMWRKAKSVFTRYIAAAKLVRFAREVEADLIHSEFRMNPYLISVSRSLGLPCVSHLRGHIRPDQVRKYRFRDVTAVISISERYKKTLIDAGVPPERITVIHDSVDLDRFKPLRTSINVLRRDFPTRGDVSVGIVGRIEPFKRQMEFLKAAEMVLERRKNVTFFVIGDVGSKSYFKRLLRFIEERDIKEHVIFTGARDDMVEVLNSLDILITFSGGSVMLEAMACGKPVISVREVLKTVPANLNWQIVRDGETGFVIQRDDIDALVETIVRLIDDPDLRVRLGDEGRRWAEERFGHEQMIRKTQEVYEGLLKGIDKPARSRIIPS
ncbi:TPA: glycosyltransferase family 1 protein [Candidatus Poribacteria bacterium]|nr:glycosyltransferase family 1 protein [Candidatus Poribacteria bacterium]HEX28566.1 glycosyltransferase family 1 protein [Candidatus Poribacteria bacterium]